MSRKLIPVFWLLIVLSLIVAACGPAETPTAAVEATEPAPEATEPAPEPTEAAAVETEQPEAPEQPVETVIVTV